VANFGRPFPAISVLDSELSCGPPGITFSAAKPYYSDWQCFYTRRVGHVWLVVVSACLSMYGYFRSFYLQSASKAARREIAAGRCSDARLTNIVLQRDHSAERGS